jgi:hypothetical protein
MMQILAATGTTANVVLFIPSVAEPCHFSAALSPEEKFIRHRSRF